MGCGEEGYKQDVEFRPVSQLTVSYSLNEDSLQDFDSVEVAKA